MSTVTYLILLHNNEQDLPQLVDSIKNIEGSFRKEYIIVDDASIDNTKSLAQELFARLPRVTILSNETYSGPAFSINHALNLIQGEYVHFAFGGHTLDPSSTAKLINACISLGTELAFGLHGTIDELHNKYKNPYDTGDTVLIEVPIKAVLENKIQDIRTIGYSGTVMSSRLLTKISGADISIFLHNMSIALRASKFSKFASIKETLCYSSESAQKIDNKFEEQDNLRAISNFIEAHTEIAEHYKPEIYKALWSILWRLGKFNIRTLPKYILSKYLKKSLELADLVQVYRHYIDKLR
jgi:glycosyltransferase involved in cell wall biosynthesis